MQSLANVAVSQRSSLALFSDAIVCNVVVRQHSSLGVKANFGKLANREADAWFVGIHEMSLFRVFSV